MTRLPCPARTLLCVMVLATTVAAQRNAAVDLLDSPIKHEHAVYDVAAISCSLPLPGTAALFGVDEVLPGAANVQLVTNELNAPFRVWQSDQSCTLISSWNTAFPGPTATGIAVANNPATYWLLDPQALQAIEFNLGVGNQTGNAFPLPLGLPLPGPAVIDSNAVVPETLCFQDIILDQIFCVDVGAGGAPLCNFANADNTGSGAFGNGIGDAADPTACANATLVHSSGTAAEGQVTRVGQYDCINGTCASTWLIGSLSTFINGIEEFLPGGPMPGPVGDPCLAIVDNVTSTLIILCEVPGIGECQEVDAGSDVLFVNGSQGGAVTLAVRIDRDATLDTAMQQISGSNGKYIFHFNPGEPSSATITPLLDLGDMCFPFLSATPAVVANNVGKTNLAGASNYFGTPQPDPTKAPAFINSMSQSVIDQFNFPSGSKWTGQAVAVNPASSSKRLASKTNGTIFCFE